MVPARPLCGGSRWGRLRSPSDGSLTHELTNDGRTERTLLEAFDSIRCFTGKHGRAPHKPLLLLLVLARLQRGDAGPIEFSEVEQKLLHLLEDFGPPGAKHPEYPFWRLRSDRVWLVESAKGTDLAAFENSSHDVPVSRLRDERAVGRLLPEIETVLTARPSLVNEIAARLLERSFPPTLHDDILDAVGMPYRAETDRRRPRDADFRELILRIYERRCAMCGFDGRLGRADFGVEAAHVQWHAFDGPDIEENGLCLCSLHHKALDAGALGVGEDGRVLVSEHLCGGSRVHEWLIGLCGRPLSVPTQGHMLPQPAFTKWHREQVFRDPPRAT